MNVEVVEPAQIVLEVIDEETLLAIPVERIITVEIGLVGPQGPPGEEGPEGPPGPGEVTVQALAAINLSGQRLVVPLQDGTVTYADPFDLAHLNRPVWLTTGAVLAGDPADLLALGEFAEPTWAWVPGAIYLGAAGTPVQTPPVGAAFWLQVGSAIDATSLFLDPNGPIVLS